LKLYNENKLIKDGITRQHIIRLVREITRDQLTRFSKLTKVFSLIKSYEANLWTMIVVLDIRRGKASLQPGDNISGLNKLAGAVTGWVTLFSLLSAFSQILHN